MPRLPFVALGLACLFSLPAMAQAPQPASPTEELEPLTMPDMPDLDRFERLAKTSPAPIARFMERAIECFHWGGEEPYDRARAREIARNVRRLNCDGLANEEPRLRQRFVKDAAVIQLLDEAKAAALY